MEQLRTPAGDRQPNGRARLQHIIRLSDQPQIAYELKPNLSMLFGHAPITTNADGYHGPLFHHPCALTHRLNAETLFSRLDERLQKPSSGK